MNADKNHRPVTILLVEDDDVDAQGVIRSFSKRRIGNDIIRARDGLEALELLESGKIQKPYLILLDLQMPRMNGKEFLKAIREDHALKTSVIFVLTTSKADTDIASSFEKNVAGYFVKDDVGANFSNMIDVLEGYWKIAYLPA